MISQALFTSRSEDWPTPQHVFDEMDKEFHFALDAAASADNAKCKLYMTKEQNALKHSWHKICKESGKGMNVYLNPPYGKEIVKWMEKAYRESEAGCTVVCLVHARTDTIWFQDWSMKADEIRLVRGRLKFGDGKQSAPFPSCVVVFRPTSEHKTIYNTPLVRSVSFKKIKGRNIGIQQGLFILEKAG